MQKIITSITAALMASAAMTAPTKAQEMTLKLSHFFPTSIFLHTEFIAKWAENLKECTGGKVDVEVHGAGSALGDPNRQFDQARAGVVDVAFGHTGFPRGRFPRSSIIEFPFLTGSANANSFALWSIAEEHLKPEYPDVHILAMMSHNPGLIHANAPVEKLEDIKGMRLRTPNATTSAVLEHFGAEAIGMGPGDIYENLQKGTIDGIAMEWTGIGAYKLTEVLKYHFELPLFTVGFYFVMNQAKYDSLPEDVRACVDEVSGDNLVATFGPMWDASGVAGYEAEKASPDDVILQATPEQIEGWKEELKPVTEALMQSLRDNGVANPEEIRDALEAEIAKYDS